MLNSAKKIIEWNSVKIISGKEYPISRTGHSLDYNYRLRMLFMFGGLSSEINNDLYMMEFSSGKYPQLIN
jgi:hypothetical protein